MGQVNEKGPVLILSYELDSLLVVVLRELIALDGALDDLVVAVETERIGEPESFFQLGNWLVHITAVEQSEIIIETVLVRSIGGKIAQVPLANTSCDITQLL